MDSTRRKNGTPDDYLNWISRNTKTSWWHDSADPQELAFGMLHGRVQGFDNLIDFSYRESLSYSDF